jgi:hypothetical protein
MFLYADARSRFVPGLCREADTPGHLGTRERQGYITLRVSILHLARVQGTLTVQV